MKNSAAAIVILIFFSSSAISQPIVSIGELRIGMPEDEFLNLQDIKSKNTQDASSKKFNSSDRDVWKKNHESAVPDSYARMPQYWKIYTPEYVVYEFKFSTGIKDISGKDSYDATVDFYKKELISVRINISKSFSQFKDILTEKYGSPTVKDNMTKEICQNGYGAKSEHNTGYMTWSWEGKGPIEASLMLSNSDCGKYPVASYFIRNSNIKLLVSELERKARQAAMSEDTKAKAASSKL